MQTEAVTKTTLLKPSSLSFPRETLQKPSSESSLMRLWEQITKKSSILVAAYRHLLEKTTSKKTIELKDINDEHFPDLKPEFLNLIKFIIREIFLATPNHQDRRELACYYLEAIEAEAHQRLTHTYYKIQFSEEGLELHDPRYSNETNLKKINQKAIAAYPERPHYQQRFQKEQQQIEHLINSILETIQQVQGISPVAVLEKTTANLQKEQLKQRGWKSAPNLLKPKVRRQLKISEESDCLVAPKQLYLMPQSKIHPGGWSIIVVAQQAFIPETNQFIVLHTQQQARFNWEDHFKLLRIMGQEPSLPAPLSAISSNQNQILEDLVMQQLVTLDEEHQTKPPELIMSQIFAALNKSRVTTSVSQESLQNYVSYLLALFSHHLERGLTTDGVKELYHYLTHAILTGIAKQEPMTHQKLQKLLKEFHAPHRKTATTAKQVVKNTSPSLFSSGTGFNFSSIECLVGGALNPVNANSGIAGVNGSVGNHSSRFGSSRGLFSREKSCENHNTCPFCGAHVEGNICFNCLATRPGAPKKDIQTAARLRKQRQNDLQSNSRISTQNSSIPRSRLNSEERQTASSKNEFAADTVGLSYFFELLFNTSEATPELSSEVGVLSG